MPEGYDFFQNKSCKYFPCHKGIPEEEFNCLFCFCPLYYAKCRGGGKITESGIKDCTGCLLPHKKGGYEYIIGRIKEINKEQKGKI